MFTEVNLSNILQILSILGFGGAILVTMRNNLASLKEDVFDMKVEIKKVGDVIIKMAVADTRIANLENDIRELRHGKGFISVNGEYDKRGKIRDIDN